MKDVLKKIWLGLPILLITFIIGFSVVALGNYSMKLFICLVFLFAAFVIGNVISPK